MKPKQLIVLIATCGVVLGIALWKRAGRAGDDPDSPSSENPPLFADFDPGEVGSFTVKSAKSETTVAREGEKWVVANRDKFPASSRHVTEMLNNTGAFHVASYEDFDKDALAGNKLLSPGEGKDDESGTLVTMAKPNGGSEILSFVAGSSIAGKGEMGAPPKAQWMKVKGGDKVAKVMDGFSNLQAEPKEWLDKDKFFKVEKLKSAAVAGPTPEESWKVVREKEGGDLKLDAPAAGEEFDPAKASAQGALFSYPTFDDILPEADKAKAGLDKPTHTITAETFDGLTYTVKVGAKVEPPKPEAGKDTPPPPPTESYYITYTISGTLSETLPPFAEAAPVAPTVPVAPPADANEEAKKAYEEAKKKYDADKASHESNMKAWEERKKAADEQAKKDLEKRKETIAAQQAQQTRVWIVPKSPTLEAAMKKRAELMKDKPAATATPPANGATPPANPSPIVVPPAAPGGAASTPPMAVTPGTKPKVEAVTPAIEVKIPEGAGKDDAKKDEPKKDEAKKPEAKKEEPKKNP